MAPVPIALYAVQLDKARKVQEALLPEYDVVHVVLSPQAAENELRPLLGGDTTIAPSSEVGSNATRPAAERLVPRVLAFSPAVPEPDVQAAVKAARVPAGGYVQPEVSEVRAEGSGKNAEGSGQGPEGSGQDPEGSGQDPEAYAKALKAKLSGLGFK